MHGPVKEAGVIVQPDFCEHWKTRLLVQLTKDESAPIAVLRLWAHCQHSRRCDFPEMTSAQLASICHWGNRKPACHTALIKAAFVDKLSPKGFKAHQWDIHNAQLLQKWEAGKKGGRPVTSESTNKYGHSEKPVGHRPTTDREPERNPIDPIDQIDRSDPKGGFKGGQDSFSESGIRKSGVDGLVVSVAGILRSRTGIPTLTQVRHHLSLCFRGAEQYAEPFFETMEKQGWKDRDHKPINNWQKMAEAYASKAAINSDPKSKCKNKL
jgi:hypothetical protein